mgnify:FL=1|tara:strand:- start:237 stop:515 length:279 start_codon:yes stop_codon:yes gene_type:complete
MHPTQISKATGISINEVTERLDKTPELFIRLPKRPDGITRYRLTTTTTAKNQDEIGNFLKKQSQKESALLYAFGAMILMVILVVIIVIGPAI